MSAADRGGPLAGVRVLELTKVWAGPYAGKLLAYLGAEVIRIESRGSLDVTRTFGVDDIDQAPGFQAVNPQKLSAQIDMKSADGLALLRRLVGECDIVIENMRPGAIDRLGLGYEALRAVKADIILVSMGMYGHDGPLAYQTGYAPCFAALGGVSALVGYEGEAPAGMNMRYADSSFGAAAAYGAMVALLHRQRTGEGQYVDVSAVETMTTMIGDSIVATAIGKPDAPSPGNRHPEMAPHGLYRCGEDEWIAIAVRGEAAWQALAEAAGLADDARFATLADRKANEAALDEAVAAWTRGQDAATLAVDLQARGIAAGKSLTSLDLVADGTLWARGLYLDVADAGGEGKTTIGPSWQMTDGARIGDASPKLGEHNAYVFGEILGMSADERARLEEAGVIR